MCGMCYLCVVCWELLGGVYVCGIYVCSLHNLSSMYVVHSVCGMSVRGLYGDMYMCYVL